MISDYNSINLNILKVFLEAGDQYVSGVVLADRLGLSRVAVWKRLELLNQAGFQFDAVRNRGYRLIQEPDSLHPELLGAYFALSGLPGEVFFYDRIDSTNTEGQRLLAQNCSTPAVVIAKKQTKGKGRLGRIWESAHPGNLYCSYLFKPNVPLAHMDGFSIWAGLRLCDWIAQTYGINLQLKWPNDLVWQGKKIAGMLAEASIDRDLMHTLILGLGLNINTGLSDLPEALRSKGASLAVACGYQLPMHPLVVALTRVVFQAFEAYMQQDIFADLQSLWKKYNALADRLVAVQSQHQLITGHVVGLTATGGLALRVENQSDPVVVHSGDVTLQSVYPD